MNMEWIEMAPEGERGFRLAESGRSFVHLYPALRARMNLIMEVKMREAYFERVLTKGHRFFMKVRTGDIVTRLTEDISGYPKIAWFSCSGIFRALESGTSLIVCVGSMMLLVDWRLGLIAIAPLPFMLLIFHRIQIRQRTQGWTQLRQGGDRVA